MRQGSRQPVVAAMATALAAALLAACGSAAPATGGSGSPAGGGSPSGTAAGGGGSTGGHVTRSVTVSLTGTIPLAGSFSEDPVPYAKSCGDYAATGATGVPSPQATAPYAFAVPGKQGATVAGQSFQIDAGLDGSVFHGPGSYAYRPAGSTPGIHLMVLIVGHSVFFPLQDFTTATFTISADGSGMLAITNADDHHGGAESGTVSWTCSS